MYEPFAFVFDLLFFSSYISYVYIRVTSRRTTKRWHCARSIEWTSTRRRATCSHSSRSHRRRSSASAWPVRALLRSSPATRCLQSDSAESRGLPHVSPFRPRGPDSIAAPAPDSGRPPVRDYWVRPPPRAVSPPVHRSPRLGAPGLEASSRSSNSPRRPLVQ